MGGRNLTCPSLRWSGLDDDQMVVRDTRAPNFKIPKTSNLVHRTIVFRACPADLTPRRRLVYDAVWVHLLLCTQRRRNATWQEMQ